MPTSRSTVPPDVPAQRNECFREPQSERLQEPTLTPTPTPTPQRMLEQIFSDEVPFLPHDIFGFSGDIFEAYISDQYPKSEEEAEEDANQFLEKITSFIFDRHQQKSTVKPTSVEVVDLYK